MNQTLYQQPRVFREESKGEGETQNEGSGEGKEVVETSSEIRKQLPEDKHFKLLFKETKIYCRLYTKYYYLSIYRKYYQFMLKRIIEVIDL